jgi:hypothetical protein
MIRMTADSLNVSSLSSNCAVIKRESTKFVHIIPTSLRVISRIPPIRRSFAPSLKAGEENKNDQRCNIVTLMPLWLVAESVLVEELVEDIEIGSIVRNARV